MPSGRGVLVFAAGIALWAGARLLGSPTLHMVSVGSSCSRSRRRCSRAGAGSGCGSAGGSRTRASSRPARARRARDREPGPAQTSFLLVEDRLPPQLGRSGAARGRLAPRAGPPAGAVLAHAPPARPVHARPAHRGPVRPVRAHEAAGRVRRARRARRRARGRGPGRRAGLAVRHDERPRAREAPVPDGRRVLHDAPVRRGRRPAPDPLAERRPQRRADDPPGRVDPEVDGGPVRRHARRRRRADATPRRSRRSSPSRPRSGSCSFGTGSRSSSRRPRCRPSAWARRACSTCSRASATTRPGPCPPASRGSGWSRRATPRSSSPGPRPPRPSSPPGSAWGRCSGRRWACSSIRPIQTRSRRTAGAARGARLAGADVPVALGMGDRRPSTVTEIARAMARRADPTPGHQRLLGLLAVAGLAAATAFAFGRVFAGRLPTWELVAAALASVAIAALFERRGLLLATLASLAGLVLAITWIVLPQTAWFGLPTLRTLRAVGRSLEYVGQQARLRVAPTPPLPPLMLAAVTAVWTASFSAHALAIRAGSPLLAVLPPIALVGFADTVLDDGARPVYAVVLLCAALAVIFSDGLRRIRQWGPVWSSSRSHRLGSSVTRAPGRWRRPSCSPRSSSPASCRGSAPAPSSTCRPTAARLRPERVHLDPGTARRRRAGRPVRGRRRRGEVLAYTRVRGVRRRELLQQRPAQRGGSPGLYPAGRAAGGWWQRRYRTMLPAARTSSASCKVRRHRGCPSHRGRSRSTSPWTSSDTTHSTGRCSLTADWTRPSNTRRRLGGSPRRPRSWTPRPWRCSTPSSTAIGPVCRTRSIPGSASSRWRGPRRAEPVPQGAGHPGSPAGWGRLLLRQERRPDGQQRRPPRVPHRDEGRRVPAVLRRDGGDGPLARIPGPDRERLPGGDRDRGRDVLGEEQ